MEAYVSSHLKEMNRLNVYRLIREQDETSKAELSKLTGISAPTIIKIVNFLIDQGLVLEYGAGVSSLGRKPQILKHNKNRYFAIGVIHEGDYLKVGIANLNSEIVALKKVQVEGSLESVLCGTLFQLIDELVQAAGIAFSDILGIGMGLPGIYDTESRSIITAPLIGVSTPTDISGILKQIEEHYGLEVIVENDLNMEVVGEFGALRLSKESDLIYLSLGTGLGSGVMLNGRIRRGSHYMCGEIGYMSFLGDYVADMQNPGWLEDKINLDGIYEKFGVALKEGTVIGDVRGAVEYVSLPVALCINNLMMCFDVDNVSLGGEVFDLLGDALYEAVEDKVKHLSIVPVCLHRKVSREPGISGGAKIVCERAMKRILCEA